jgi:hypothetical protein
MDELTRKSLQDRIDDIPILHIKSLHTFDDVPEDFFPWQEKLSPSALYNCGLPCRKKMGLKTPEVKWMSIKRWVTNTPEGIILPAGVYLSIKRKEVFVTEPNPHLEKIEFILMMFPYGNVWSQIDKDTPITEEWLYSEASTGRLMLDELMRKDAAHPIEGYFKSCYEFMVGNPDQIGIHLKRKKSSHKERETKIINL